MELENTVDVIKDSMEINDCSMMDGYFQMLSPFTKIGFSRTWKDNAHAYTYADLRAFVRMSAFKRWVEHHSEKKMTIVDLSNRDFIRKLIMENKIASTYYEELKSSFNN